MNVSFGRLKYGANIVPNDNQKKVLKIIDKELNPDWVEVLQKKSKPQHCNVTNLLEREKDANISINLKSNGMIDVYVDKDLASINNDKSYIPYSNLDNKPIKITIDPTLKLVTILKKIRTFANKCYWYANEAESSKNSLIERLAELQLEKDIVKLQSNN